MQLITFWADSFGIFIFNHSDAQNIDLTLEKYKKQKTTTNFFYSGFIQRNKKWAEKMKVKEIDQTFEYLLYVLKKSEWCLALKQCELHTIFERSIFTYDVSLNLSFFSEVAV